MIIEYKSVLFLSFIFFYLNIFGQEKDYIVEVLDKGHIITVQYCISTLNDELGNNFIQIEDSTTTIVDIKFEKCISLMKDVPKHKLFTGNAESKIVRIVSPNEWIIYYYADNPWPIANSDCVARMIFTENMAEKTASFTLVAVPSEYENKDANRMTRFNVVYTFEDLENGKVKITMKGKSSPSVSVPMWLIKSAFPDVPAEAMSKFVKLVNG